MKVRTNRKRVLVQLSHNRSSLWKIAPILARSAKLKEKNDRINAILDKAFPELRGVNVRA